MADDLHRLVEHLELGPVVVVGHDIGGWVAYAYTRLHPEATSGAIVIETLLPGNEPFADADLDVALWHGEFHMIPTCPRRWWRTVKPPTSSTSSTSPLATMTSSDADVAHYAAAYGDAEHLRAAFEVYRAIPDKHHGRLVTNERDRGTPPSPHRSRRPSTVVDSLPTTTRHG